MTTTIKAVLLLLVSLLVAGVTVKAVAEPAPPVPTQAPYIEAPQSPAGAPVDQMPSRPPAPRPCPGETTIHLPGAPVPFVYCAKAKPGDPVVSDHDPSKISNDHAPAADPDACNGALDLGCQARHAVTGWFRNLVMSGIGPTFTFLGSTVFGTPEVGSAEMARTRDIWGTSQLIANTCFVLLISIAGVLLMTGTSLPREMGVRELLPRVVLAFLAANLSLVLIGYGVRFANGLAGAFLQAGKGKIDPGRAAQVMGDSIESAVNTGPVFLIFIALVAVVLAVVVAGIYIARLAITMVLIAAAPLALMFHALPFTDGLAALWWRAITGMLAIQVCQSLVFVTALQILLSDPGSDHNRMFYEVPTTRKDGLDLLLLICLLYVLIRIPSWVSRTIWRQATPRLPGQLLKTFLIYRGAGALLGKATRTGRHRHSAGNPRSTNRGNSGTGPSGSGPNGSPGGGPARGGPGGNGPAGGGPRPNRRQPGTASPANPPNGSSTNDRPGPGPQAGGAGPIPIPNSGQGPGSGPAPAAAPRTGAAHRPAHGGYPQPSASARSRSRSSARAVPTSAGGVPASAPRRPRRTAPRPHEVITLRLESLPRRAKKEGTS